MDDEIQRILKLLEDGRLTRDQASDMISALTASREENAGTEQADADREEPSGAPDDRVESRERQSRRHRGKRRHRAHRRDFLADDRLFDDIERAVSAGTRALNDVVSNTFTRGARAWHDDSNTSTLSKAEAPDGSGFVCRGNRLSVSSLRDLRLQEAEFCDNELNAAGLSDLDVRDGRFNGNAISGSSLKHVVVAHGDVTANQFNGAQLASLTVTGATLTGSRVQGTQIRDVTLADARLDTLRLDGVKLKSVQLEAQSHLNQVKLTGVFGRDWTFRDAQLSDVVLSGWRIDGFTLTRVGLEHCRFTNDYVQHYTRGRHRRHHLPSGRDICMDRVMMKNCEFVNCTFDSTTIRNCSVEDLCFEDVDFSGMTISSSEQLAELARKADVA